MPLVGEAEPLTSFLVAFMLAASRLSFIVFMMPAIGEEAIPARVRLGLLLPLSVMIAMNGLIDLPATLALSALAPLVFIEVLIGLFVGLVFRLMIWVLGIAGAAIAQFIGLAQFLGVAFQSEAQTIIGNLLSVSGAALFLSAEMHLAAIGQVVAFYGAVPVGRIDSIDLFMMVQYVTDAFAFAVILSWPYAVASLLYYLSLGFINKAMPQLMVAFVGAPFLVAAGLTFLAVASATLLVVWLDWSAQLIGSL